MNFITSGPHTNFKCLAQSLSSRVGVKKIRKVKPSRGEWKNKKCSFTKLNSSFKVGEKVNWRV